MTALIKGILMGVMVSAPVGPIGMLCIQYALQRGFMYALMAGLGAALADTCFSALAGSGVNVITDWMHSHCTLLQISGGLVVAVLGIQIYYYANVPSIEVPYRPYSDGFTVLGSTFLLTLANPLTILAFVALFSMFHDCNEGLDWMSTLLSISGVFIGSLIWWIFLASIATRIGQRLSKETIVSLRKGIGAVLVIFGLLTCIFH